MPRRWKGILAGLWMASLSPLLAVGEEASSELPRAPNQHPQSLFLSPQIPFNPPPRRVVAKAEPERLPEPFSQSPVSSAAPPYASDFEAGRLQEVQYPFEPNNAFDGDPEPRFQESLDQLPYAGTCDAPHPRRWLWTDVGLTNTTLPRSGDDLGMTTFDFRATGYFEHLPMLQLTPRFSGHLLSGPAGPDLPPRLYDFALDTTLYLPVGDRWFFLANIAPSMFSDFENTSSDAFRITGRALGFYSYSETVRIAAGFLYLDRDDIRALPAGGVIYTPEEDVKLEFMFPRPKFAYRIHHRGGLSRWVYLAGELGGGSWAIERANGANDVVSYRDYRAIVGFEQTEDGFGQFLVELGVVFNREIEYTSGVGDTDQSPTAMLRAGFAF